MSDKLDRVAGNGLINRRHLLKVGLGGLGSVLAADALSADAGLKLKIPQWSQQPGPGTSAYGSPSPFTGQIQRVAGPPDPL